MKQDLWRIILICTFMKVSFCLPSNRKICCSPENFGTRLSRFWSLLAHTCHALSELWCGVAPTVICFLGTGYVSSVHANICEYRLVALRWLIRFFSLSLTRLAFFSIFIPAVVTWFDPCDPTKGSFLSCFSLPFALDILRLALLTSCTEQLDFVQHDNK